MIASPRATAILHFLRSYHANNGYAPTYREIAEGVELKTTSTVTYHLKKLEKAEAIRWDKDRNGARITRGIVILE